MTCLTVILTSDNDMQSYMYFEVTIAGNVQVMYVYIINLFDKVFTQLYKYIQRKHLSCHFTQMWSNIVHKKWY